MGNIHFLTILSKFVIMVRHASALLGSLCVGKDPVLPECCPGVDPGVSLIGAAVSPADHSSDDIAAILREDKRTAGVSLTRVLAGVSGADVHVSDGPVAVSLLAGGVGGDGDIYAVEDCGLVAPGLESAPA